jgi:hypothetical protein
MQDEITEKAVRLAITVNKVTYSALKKAVEKLLAEVKKTAEKPKTKAPRTPPQPKRGKQTLKQLSKQGDGLSTVELKDPNLRQLYREMKRHNVDFSAVKDGKGKYTLFFKGKDTDSITHAFKRYTAKTVQLANQKPPIQKVLAAAKAAAKALQAGRDKVKNRDKGAR